MGVGLFKQVLLTLVDNNRTATKCIADAVLLTAS